YRAEDRVRVRNILSDLITIAPNEVQSRYRYLYAVLSWLTGDEVGARESFRLLASETEYVERGRVISRHVIADESGQPLVFEGIIDRQFGDKRWSVFVDKLGKRVDLIESGQDSH